MVASIGLEKARLYEKYRLPYASEMVDDLLRQTGSAEVVADIGAGTGQLARLFAPKCEKVYAIEPDAAMRQVASEVLQVYPNVELMAAAAEQTTLPDAAIDLIIIGNAFHRFRAEAIAEMRRILKKSGWVALVSYQFTNTAFCEMLFSRLGQLESVAARSAKTWHQLPVTALFGDPPTQTLYYPQSFTEDWAAFWGSACSGIEAPNPHDADFAQFQRINREVFEAFCVEGQIRMEYETRVLFGQLKI